MVAADNEFSLRVDLLNKEVSKDSNSQRYSVEVKGKEVRYTYSYRGFPDNSEQEKSWTLTDQEQSELINYIQKKGINRAITEIKSTDANGPSRKVHLTLLLTIDGTTTESKISGNYKIYRGDGNIRGAIIENKEYVDAVQSLVGKF